MATPTRAEVYVQLNEHITKAQEAAAMLAHLHNTEGNDADKILAKMWLGVSEMFKKIQHQVTQLMMGKLQ